MNNRFLNIFSIIASCTLFAVGCSEDNSSFETPAAAGDTPLNDGLISQNNFTILFSEPTPKYYDPETGSYSAVTSDISVQIGDNKNQLITGSHTIFFRTEWGLIDPSCVTENGGCSVTWRSGSPDTMPADFFNAIVAYTSTGQESFGDVNGNGLFDDGDIFDTDIFSDVEEPFINVDGSFTYIDGIYQDTYTAGDIIIDTINGVDLTGANETHDDGDTLYNGPKCSHTVLCSTTRTTVTVWESGEIWLNGGAIVSVGGTVTGLTGDVELQNNLSDTLTISADGPFEYTMLGGSSYSITANSTVGQTCTVSNGAGTSGAADITDIAVDCI